MFTCRLRRAQSASRDKRFDRFYNLLTTSDTNTELTSKSSTEALRLALDQGVRVLELDISSGGSKGEPIITHGNQLVASITLREALAVCKEHGFKTSVFPLIISLDLKFCSESGYANVSKILQEVLGESLYRPQLGADTMCIPSPDELRKKIVLRGDGITPGKEEYNTTIGPLVGMAKFKHRSRATAGDQSASAGCWTTSLGISKFNGLLSSENGPSQFSTQTEKSIFRIYPESKQALLLSTNFCPDQAWSAGCQMIAMNIQKGDEPVWQNFAKFQDNGGCGYLLKDRLLPTQDIEIKLTVKIIGLHNELSGGWGYEKDPDCYCTLKILGADHKDYPKTKKNGKEYKLSTLVEKTRIVYDNKKPQWNEEFEFTLHNPQTLQLLITMYDYDKVSGDDFMGQSCVPLSDNLKLDKVLHLPMLSKNNRRDSNVGPNCDFKVKFSKSSQKYSATKKSLHHRGRKTKLAIHKEILKSVDDVNKDKAWKTMTKCKKHFEKFDINDDNFIDFSELQFCLEKLGHTASRVELSTMFKVVDGNEDNLLDYTEFCQFILAQEQLISVKVAVDKSTMIEAALDPAGRSGSFRKTLPVADESKQPVLEPTLTFRIREDETKEKISLLSSSLSFTCEDLKTIMGLFRTTSLGSTSAVSRKTCKNNRTQFLNHQFSISSASLLSNHYAQLIVYELYSKFCEGRSGLNNPVDYTDAVFAAFDEQDKGTVDWREFVLFLNKHMAVDLQDRLGYMFEVFDADGSGEIEFEEMYSLMMRLHKMKGSEEERISEATFRGLAESSVQLDEAIKVSNALKEWEEKLGKFFKAMDTNQDQKISLEEFIDGVSDNPELQDWLGLGSSQIDLVL